MKYLAGCWNIDANELAYTWLIQLQRRKEPISILWFQFDRPLCWVLPPSEFFPPGFWGFWTFALGIYQPYNFNSMGEDFSFAEIIPSQPHCHELRAALGMELTGIRNDLSFSIATGGDIMVKLLPTHPLDRYGELLVTGMTVLKPWISVRHTSSLSLFTRQLTHVILQLTFNTICWRANCTYSFWLRQDIHEQALSRRRNARGHGVVWVSVSKARSNEQVEFSKGIWR